MSRKSLEKMTDRDTRNCRYREGVDSTGEFVQILEEFRTAGGDTPFYVLTYVPDTGRLIEQVAEVHTAPSGVPFHSKSIRAGKLRVTRDEIIK